MLSPKDVDGLKLSWLERTTDLIDQEIINNHGNNEYEYAELNMKISKEDRDTICKAYINAGWNFAYHRSINDMNHIHYKACFGFSMRSVIPQLKPENGWIELRALRPREEIINHCKEILSE